MHDFLLADLEREFTEYTTFATGGRMYQVPATHTPLRLYESQISPLPISAPPEAPNSVSKSTLLSF